MKKVLADKKGNLRVVWGVLFGLIYGFGLMVILAIVGALIDNSTPFYSNVMMGLLGTPLYLIGVRGFMRKNRLTAELGYFDMFKHLSIKKIVGGFLCGAALYMPQYLLAVLLGQAEVTMGGISITTAISAFATFLGMAAFEESVIRVLFSAVLKKFGTAVAMMGSSLLFVLCHTRIYASFNILDCLDLFCAGICFWMMLKATRSLTFTVMAHMAFNFVQTAILGVDAKGMFATTIHSAATASILSICSCLILAGLFYAYNKTQTKALSSANSMRLTKRIATV